MAGVEMGPTSAITVDPPPASTAPPSTHRLSTPFPTRLALMSFVASGAGFCLGVAHGSTESGLRFRAEHAHKLPTSQTGWYLYHKSKNYHVILGGLKEGFKMAGKVGLWSGVFVLMEEGVDRGRAACGRLWRDHAPKYQGLDVGVVEVQRDFLSTTLAGLGTAGLFSTWNGFPLPTAVRVAKMSAKVGLAFGVLQDGVSLLRGRRLGYVEFVKRNVFGTADQNTVTDKAVATG